MTAQDCENEKKHLFFYRELSILCIGDRVVVDCVAYF